MNLPDRWAGWIATIAPTGAGTFGIWWSNAPAMERRGGYSGPYHTRAEAEAGARIWMDSFDVQDFTIEHKDFPNGRETDRLSP